MRILLILAFTTIQFLQLNGQNLDIISRMSYYTTEPSAEFLLFGSSFDEINSIELLNPNVQGQMKIQPHSFDCGSFQIELGGLDAGEYILNVKVILNDLRELQLETMYTILAAKENEVKIDRLTGGLYVDDLPFYPFGFYTGSPVGDLPIQEVYNGMNLIGVYQNNEMESLGERKAYMDLCASLGIKVNYSVNGLIGNPHDRTDYVISDEEKEKRERLLKNEIESFKDHPALLSWYMNDEPVGQGRSPELLEEAYQLIRDIDPYHPVSVVFVIPERAKAFEHTMDIAMTDPYPIPGDVNEVKGHMQSLQKHFKYKKALWLVPQAFGGGEFWSREPTGDEMRIMTYLGLYEGAMGIKYFIRRIPNLFPKSRLAWNEAIKIAHEISMLYPYLFNGSGINHLETDHENILAGYWQHHSEKLIMVLNTRNKPASIDLEIPFLAGSGIEKANVLFKNREVDLRENVLMDMINGYDVQFYRIVSEAEENSIFTKYNLFSNSGFEKWTSPGVPQGSYASSDLRPHYDGSTYFIDSRNPHNGNYALRLNSVSDSSHISLAFYRMHVNANHWYHCSFWTRSPKFQDSVAFKVSIPQLDTEYMFWATPGWNQHQFNFSIDSNVNAIQWILETVGKGTFWLDDIVTVPDPMIDVFIGEDARALITLKSMDEKQSILYSDSKTKETLYDGPFFVNEYTELQVSVDDSKKGKRQIEVVIPISKATLRSCQFMTPYSKKYQGNGAQTLVDGSFASLSFRDGKWLGFDGKDVSFIVDLGKVQEINEVTGHFLVSVDDGIHSPTSMEVSVAGNDGVYSRMGSMHAGPSEKGEAYFQEMAVVETVSGRFIKFNIKSPTVIPDGYLFAGTDAWIFIDEVMVF